MNKSAIADAFAETVEVSSKTTVIEGNVVCIFEKKFT